MDQQLPQSISALLEQSPALALLAFFIWATFKAHIVMGWQYREKVDENRSLTQLVKEGTVLSTRAVQLGEQSIDEMRKLVDLMLASGERSKRALEMAEDLQEKWKTPRSKA